jgi:predicted nucleic acid-binding protein
MKTPLHWTVDAVMLEPIMKPTVYIETSIPSFFYEKRTQPEMRARRNWTREWWKSYSHLFVLKTSEAVVAELEDGDFISKEKALALIESVDMLDIAEEIADIIDVYIEHQLMPKDRLGDATHLALASLNKCDFLLTWNCRHIANANKFEHIRIINNRLGLFTPALVTPMELCRENTDEG